MVEELTAPEQPAAPVSAPPEQSTTEIGKTTIVTLVLLTLLVSVLGTWTVLNQVGTPHTPGIDGEQSSGARASITIAGPKQAETQSSGGTAAITITQPSR